MSIGTSTGTALSAENYFRGWCELKGVTSYERPLTTTRSANRYRTSADGVCGGELNGAQVDRAPVRDESSGPFEGSCVGARSTAPGDGRLTFAGGTDDPTDDVVITYRITWSGDAVEGVDYRIEGSKSGRGYGHADVGTPESAAHDSARCAGDGLAETTFRAYAYTETPLVSEVPGPGPTCAPASGVVGAKRLGPVRLGARRAAIWDLFPRQAVDSQGEVDHLCLADGRELRVAYVKRARVPRAAVITTTSRHFEVRGIRAGVPLDQVKKRLRGSSRTRAAGFKWHLLQGRRSAALIKVDTRRVRSVGLMGKRLAATREKRTRLLRRLGRNL